MLGMLQAPPTPKLSFPDIYSNDAPLGTTNENVFERSAVLLKLLPDCTIPVDLVNAHAFFVNQANTIQEALRENKDHLPNGDMEQLQLVPRLNVALSAVDNIGGNLKSGLECTVNLLRERPDLGDDIMFHAQAIIQAVQTVADCLTR